MYLFLQNTFKWLNENTGDLLFVFFVNKIKVKEKN